MLRRRASPVVAPPCFTPVLRHFRLFTTVVIAVALLAVAGLFAADRVLQQSDRSHVAVDAVESASLVRSFLAVHAEVLGAFEGLALGTKGAIDAESFRQFTDAMREHFQGFRRVWLTDENGVIRNSLLIGTGSDNLAGDIDLDTLTLLGMRETVARARSTKRAQVSRPGRIFTGEYGFAVIEPIYVGDRFVGFAGGTVAARDLLRSIETRHLGDRTEIVVLAGRDTVVARTTESGGGERSDAAPIEVPGGAEWRVFVRHSAGRVWARWTLWIAGPLALAALLLGLRHERREQLSVELMRANRSKSEFLANVSHELRTPLNAIVGFTDLLRDGVYGELTSRQAGPVQRIEASANHLRVLVDQILDLAKMAAGRLEVHTEILDLRPFALNVATEIESLVSEKNLSLTISIAGTVPRVRTDPTHLRQILINLLGNAVRYTPSGGISVRGRLVPPISQGSRPPDVARADRQADATARARELAGETSGERLKLMNAAPRRDSWWVALQVIDTGVGIPKADQKRIFEEFEQVNAGPRGDSMRRGTGLGLPISRRLANLIGGDVTLESEPGKGSTFTVWLPVDEADIKS
jgi:signal transduction histidine kinase